MKTYHSVIKLLPVNTLLIVLLLNGCGGKDDPNILEGTGTIEVVNVTLSAKTGGEIKQILFKEGSEVKTGDTIIIIDDEALRIQLRQQEAAVRIASLQYDLMKKGARREDISFAEANMDQAQVNYELAKNDLERMDQLFKSQSITKKQLDDIKARFDIAKSQLESSKENLRKMKSITRPEELQQAEARLIQSVSNTELLKKSINDCYIKSPINGNVIAQYFEEGETVSPMSSLLKVADMDQAELMVYIPESDIPRVQYNDSTEVTIDAYEDKKFYGRVVFISPEAEFTPKNIQTKDERTKLVFGVKIIIPNGGNELKAGMPADAKIIIR